MVRNTPLLPFVEHIDKWKTKKMNEPWSKPDAQKEIVPLNADLWPNGKKVEDWMADYMGKIIVPPSDKETWYNIYENDKTIPNGTVVRKTKLKKMSDEEVEKYCSNYQVVAEGQESWRKNTSDSYIDPGPRTPAEDGDDIPF